MKKNLFVLAILSIVIGLFAESFEFLGIRSGMTKDEVKVVIEYDKLSNEGSYDWIKPKSIFDNDQLIHLTQHHEAKENYLDKNHINKFTEYPAYEIQFSFTNDNILWKIMILIEQTSVSLKSFPIDSEAQLNAIESSFPKAKIEIGDKIGSYSTFIYISLADEDIFNVAVQKKMNEYLIQYND